MPNPQDYDAVSSKALAQLDDAVNDNHALFVVTSSTDVAPVLTVSMCCPDEMLVDIMMLIAERPGVQKILVERHPRAIEAAKKAVSP